MNIPSSSNQDILSILLHVTNDNHNNGYVIAVIYL